MTQNTGKKDFFSGHSRLYATFRPTYPKALYDFIFQHIHDFSCAWDCATGNGQVASYLSKHFKKVCATDISQQQLDNAYQAENIFYSVSSAEETNFPTHQFDLITVGQAVHWFHQERFYNEVKRVAKPGACLAIWGYNLCSVNPHVNEQLQQFYRETVGPFWDEARKFVEDEYTTIAFPFEKIPSPKFFIEVEWSAEEFAGYVTTWSATQKFMKANGHNPVPAMMKNVSAYWKERERVTFPIFLLLGKVN